MKRLMLPVVMLFAVAVLLAAIFARQTEMPQWYLDTGLSTTDTDMDGIPDAWERRMRSDPAVADSGLDRDGDGLTDLEEFKLGSNPCMFSTAGDFWSDKEKRDMGFAPSARVEPTVSLAQWQAYLGWTREQWLDWAPPDQHGFGWPYSSFVHNTLPYSDPSRNDTVDFWLKRRIDRPVLATVGDRLSTNSFPVLPGERRYRLRIAKDGPVSLTLDPLPGSLAKLPGATNGLWLCEMSLESAQTTLVVFPAGSPPYIHEPPAGLEALAVGDEPEEEPPDAPGPQLLAGAAGNGGASFHPLADGPLWLGAVHERVILSGDYGGTWCLCSCVDLPTFGSFSIGAPGGATLNGQPLAPSMPLFDSNEVTHPLTGAGAVTQSVASVKYQFMRRNIVVWFGGCKALGKTSIHGVEGSDSHEPGRFEDSTWSCDLRGCECSGGGPTVAIGFDHAKVNTRNLFHPEESEGDKEYQHCLGITWSGQTFNLTNLVEYSGLDLVDANCTIKWEVDGDLKDSPELDLGDRAPDDLKARVFRIKMVYVYPDGNNQSVWDRLILVVNNPATKTSFDNWYTRFSAETNWLAELPAAYSALGPWTNHTVYITSPSGGLISFEREDFSDPEPAATNLWAGIDGLGKFIHHTAARQMRSHRTPGGHGHQACYDTNGVIILSGVSAGTADFGAALLGTVSEHKEFDVKPFIRALQLDGNPCRQSMKSLTHAIIHQGGNVGKYLQCRPAIPNNKQRLNPGEVPLQ